MADIVGGAALRRALQAKAQAIVAAASRATDDAAAAVRDDMRAHVAVDTGALRAGIEDRKTDATHREVGVFDGKLYYAKYEEHGTSTRPARPFILPAAERERRRYPQRVADAINKEMR